MDKTHQIEPTFPNFNKLDPNLDKFDASYSNLDKLGQTWISCSQLGINKSSRLLSDAYQRIRILLNHSSTTSRTDVKALTATAINSWFSFLRCKGRRRPGKCAYNIFGWIYPYFGIYGNGINKSPSGAECQICTLPRFTDPSKAHSPAILSSIMPEKPVFDDRFANQRRIRKDNILANK